MQTKNDLLAQMETLIQQLANSTKPKIDFQGPIGTTMNILGQRDLSVTQRMILLYLVFDTDSETKQKNICDYLGISMKCVRENCEILMELDYIGRGTKASTWSLV